MRQGCKTIDLGKSVAVMCGGEPTDHKCNEDAMCYETITGERFLFKNSNEADKWASIYKRGQECFFLIKC